MSFFKRLSTNIFALLFATVAVHLVLVALGKTVEVEATGDVLNSYQPWVDALSIHGKWGGVNTVWVYPFLAWAPMLLAKLLSFAGFDFAWYAIALILNLAALLALVSWGRRKQNFAAAWFAVGFIALLGPVAISRLDGISVSFAVIAISSVVLVGETFSTGRALVWLNVAAWIKVWPVALILGLFQKGKESKNQLAVLAISTLIILAFGGLLGANANIFSFVMFQSDRGLQIESPIANTWVWLSALGVGRSRIYFDTVLMTYQVSGPLDSLFSTLIGLAMLVAIAITAWLIFKAHRNGVSASRIAAFGSLTATLDLIVFNKVGSPQYQLWILAPIVLGLVLGVQNWRFACISGLVLALLTHLIYPINYVGLVASEIPAVALLTARNITLIVLLVWSNLQLSKKPKTQAAL